MQFQLRPFKELIALSKEKIDEALAPLRASTAKAKATLKMAEIDEKIAVLGQKIQEQATSKEIDFDAMADKIDEIALLELRKERFAEITKQLFPEAA
jgi:predicted nucleic acid-binding protein